MMSSLKEMLSKSDYDWYREEFNQTEQKKLSSHEMDDIIRKSIKSAEDVFENAKEDLNVMGSVGMVEHYGTKVSFNTENDSNRLIAMYDRRENMLIIFNHSIDTLHERIKQAGMSRILDKDTLRDLIIAHELYHIIEMNEEDVFTYSKFYETKILGFTRKNRLATASEIGAFHFSKIVTGVNFSPCIIGSLQDITDK